MGKSEKAILSFVEKHILIIGAILITAAAFFFRRQGIWFRTQDFEAYFDMHEHSTNTAFYYLCIRALGYLFPLPINGWKWLLSAGDLAAAVLLVLLFWKAGGNRSEYEKTRLLFLYAGCLLSPVLYIRGSIWAQPDSLAYAFLLGGCLCLKKGRKAGAVLLAGAGLALYPPCILPAAVYLLAAGVPLYLGLAAAAVCILAEAAGALGAGVSPGEAAAMLVRFLSTNPVTGEGYAGMGEWLWQMLLAEGYGLGLLGAAGAFSGKIPYAAAILLHAALAVCFSIALGWMTL